MSGRSDIAECVRHSLERSFRNLDGEPPSGLYDMVLRQMERPMLEVVMREAEGNQTRAADMLGMNRNTLRRKLTDHGML